MMVVKTAKLGKGQFSNHALDMMATGLSKFDNPIIPELELKDDRTLQNNMLECIFGITGSPANFYARHIMTEVVRRIFSSIETYRLGRESSLAYVSGDRHFAITPYFRALTAFECCVQYSWQICDWLNHLSEQGQLVFVKGDGTAWERLYRVYTYGTKHSPGQYDATQPTEMPTAIWLTNEGIECIEGASLKFHEISEIIAANNELFYNVQKAIQKKQKSAECD